MDKKKKKKKNPRPLANRLRDVSPSSVDDGCDDGKAKEDGVVAASLVSFKWRSV